jgi:hypothetical protein
MWPLKAHLTQEEAEAIKNAVVWLGLPLNTFVSEAMRHELQKYVDKEIPLFDRRTGKVITKKPGEPFPPRLADLRPGRKVR